MQCMLMTQPNTILMGGHQPLVVELDVEARKEVRQVRGHIGVTPVSRKEDRQVRGHLGVTHV